MGDTEKQEYPTESYQARFYHALVHRDSCLSDDLRDVRDLRSCEPWMIARLGLRRGDIVTFSRGTGVYNFVLIPQYRFGFNGEPQAYPTTKQETIEKEEVLKLWKTKARGWYWKQASATEEAVMDKQLAEEEVSHENEKRDGERILES